MSKFAKGTISKKWKVVTKKKRNIYIFLFSPGNLLITLYQLSNFGAPCYNGLWDIKFSMIKFAKGNN